MEMASPLEEMHVQITQSSLLVREVEMLQEREGFEGCLLCLAL